MKPGKEKILKDKIIKAGARIYQLGLTTAKSGNISTKLDDRYILITARGTCLGNLKYQDIVKVNLKTSKPENNKHPSLELRLHSLIYKNFPYQTVIHCHPPLINGYFAVNSTLKPLILETKLYLRELPVVKQSTPTVTKPQLVIEALKKSNLVILQYHGVVLTADRFEEGLSLIESLEQAVRVAAIARLFNKKDLDKLDKSLKQNLTKRVVRLSSQSRSVTRGNIQWL